MAKAKYVPVSADVEEMVNGLFNSFFDRFSHVKRVDLYLCFKDAPKSSYKARTRLLNGFYRGLTQKKIVIEIHKQEWELSKTEERALLLYRELYRIDLNKEKTDYKLTRPDLTDFTKILEKVGLHGETAGEFFKKIVSPVEAK